MLGIKPKVPSFEGTALDGRTINIEEATRKQPVLIVFFSPKCHNCEAELDFLNSIYVAGELKDRFEVVALNTLNRFITEKFIKEKKYPFPVIIDASKKIASLFPSFLGPVPVCYVVDQQGQINAIYTGFSAQKKNIYMMTLRKLAGLPNPPLLQKEGYSGEKHCKICHESEHLQWTLTGHADAFRSVVRKGAEDDENCVSCHVTGFGKKGGYTLETKRPPKHLEGVQCESCHGPGHESCSGFTGKPPKKKKAAEWKKVCLTCHTKEESLDFVFAKRYARILHTSAPDFSAMTREERLKLARASRERQNVFDSQAAYVGAQACRDCHGEQYEMWQKTVHAGIHTSERAEKAPAEEMFRYNTGVGGSGGYPELGREGVQCEACHGPGEKHVKEPDVKNKGYIISLGAKCSSCVVEQICRGCHTFEFDPEFNFEKQIEKVRHKTKVKPAG